MERSNAEKPATVANGATALGGGSPTAKAAKPRTRPSTIKAALSERKAHHVKKAWESAKKAKAGAATLRSRLAKLRALGVMPGQIADILELSYAGARGITDGDLNPHPDKLKGYHARVTVWCAKVSRV